MPIKPVKKTKKSTKTNKKRTKSLMNDNVRAQKMNVILDSIRHCGMITDACNAVQIDRTTYYLWLEKYPAFRKRVMVAETESIHSVARAMHKHANGYDVPVEYAVLKDKEGNEKAVPVKYRHIPPDATSGIFLLCNKLADQFKNIQRVEGVMTNVEKLEVGEDDYKKLKQLAETIVKAKVGIK